MATLTPEQKKLFTDKNFVAIATVGKDGTPRNTILWVDAEDDYWSLTPGLWDIGV